MVPVADGDALSIAMANPLDGFAKQAFQLLAQKPVRASLAAPPTE